MIKMYGPGLGGDDPGYWEDSWSVGSLGEALRFCEWDPLRGLIERMAPAGTRMLEGGCGLGQYVVFYGRRDRRVIGLDFARGTLRQLKAAEPGATVCVGDVGRLPFLDESFDVYFSGGVVEHFEPGPATALDEAWRVLRGGGRFLVSVPYASPLRRVKARCGLAPRTWQVSAELRFERDYVPGTRFWQYAFSRSEFAGLLERAGFRVLETQTYALLWGLYELPGVNRLVNTLRNKPNSPVLPGQTPRPPEVLDQPAQRRPLREWIQRLVIREDRDLPLVGKAISAAAALAANMIMFACEKVPKRGIPESEAH